MGAQTISILGCGWYGLAMAKELVANSYKVKGSTTNDEKLEILKSFNIQPYLVSFETNQAVYEEDFFNCDILIISIPPKKNAQAAYPIKLKNIVIAAEKAKVKQIIFISSTGIFPNANFIVDETFIPHPNTAAGEALMAAEDMLRNNLQFETTIIRFAGLIGPERNLARHFAGKKEISNGFSPINLIHLADCIGITKAIIEQMAFGKIYHGVTPNHPTRKDFYTKACNASGFQKPEFKDELLDWKQIESKNVSEVLTYEYVYDIWDNYFKELAAGHYIE